ncbi:MAG: hypothetical protein J0L80_00995 [Chitinophagales bacterium]|nr:hypothetical protein [Chitinophagales bacterium]
MNIKQWHGNTTDGYKFNEGGKPLAELKQIAPGHFSSKIDGHEYHFEFKGFWHTTVKVSDRGNNSLFVVSPDKWYANNYSFGFHNKQYKLLIQNNPMSEYLITENDEPLLSYALATDTNKMLLIRIKEKQTDVSLLLHTFLWLMFEPIAHENFGSSYKWQYQDL